MNIKIANIIEDSITDGPGLRTTIFVQGCIHNCKNCHNPDTHDINGGKEMDTSDIVDKYFKNNIISGITLSGGEPFLQPFQCFELAIEAKQAGLSVWCYTGYTYEALKNMNDPDIDLLLHHIDVLVDGPFIDNLKSYELHFKGSSNQRTINMKETIKQGKVVLLDTVSSVVDKFKIPPED